MRKFLIKREDLTPEDMKNKKKHPEIGYRILSTAQSNVRNS
jgi:response regulator RpfG family c-di-GMP phosphodiesterase